MTDTSPTIVNRTLPSRLPNQSYRPRKYLTEKEVDRVIEAGEAKGKEWRKGCSGDATRLQTWPASARTLLASLVADRSAAWQAACEQS